MIPSTGEFTEARSAPRRNRNGFAFPLLPKTHPSSPVNGIPHHAEASCAKPPPAGIFPAFFRGRLDFRGKKRKVYGGGFRPVNATEAISSAADGKRQTIPHS